MLGWAPAVYILCMLTSTACAALLARAYRRSGMRMLLWTAACFALLALNNVVVVVDLLVLPQIDLVPLRTSLGLAAVATLLYGFIWEID